MREFDSGATRDTDTGKLDYEGFLSPIVLHRYARYMNKNRIQADGKIRASDNWQKGIPLEAYMKSGFRHFMDWWLIHRGYRPYFDAEKTVCGSEYPPCHDVEEAVCALIFNAMGYLHEILKGQVDG